MCEHGRISERRANALHGRECVSLDERRAQPEEAHAVDRFHRRLPRRVPLPRSRPRVHRAIDLDDQPSRCREEVHDEAEPERMLPPEANPEPPPRSCAQRSASLRSGLRRISRANWMRVKSVGALSSCMPPSTQQNRDSRPRLASATCSAGAILLLLGMHDDNAPTRRSSDREMRHSRSDASLRAT